MIMPDDRNIDRGLDSEENQMTTDPLSTSTSELSSNMAKKNRTRLTFPFGACRVCSDSATGIHYGIATCEGCKGFFKRSILRKEKYRCYFDNSCHINVNNRNRCKACRFRRCLDEGMSVDGVKMGRIPKLVKERALREQREQQMREEAAAVTENSDRSDELRPRESSCSSTSDRSIENYDPETNENRSTKNESCVVRCQNETNNVCGEKSSTDSSINVENQRNDRPLVDPCQTTIIRSRPFTSKFLDCLPDDFTVDEVVGLTFARTEPLSNELFQYIRAVCLKLSYGQLNTFPRLTDDESHFIEFLRSMSQNVFVRHSRRLKQLQHRMNLMVRQNILETAADHASIQDFLATLPKTVEATVRCSVLHVQELPGMANMESNNLNIMILKRSFDLFLLKYHTLLNENGQSYFLSLQGFPYTRRWLNFLYGVELTEGMFDFAQRLRQLNLNDREIALINPVQICFSDKTMKDQETPKMLRACYLYALYDELRYNRGEQEGRLVCSKILQILDLLIPLREIYEKNVGSRLVQDL